MNRAERRRSLLGWHGKIRIPIFLDVVGHSCVAHRRTLDFQSLPNCEHVMGAKRHQNRDQFRRGNNRCQAIYEWPIGEKVMIAIEPLGGAGDSLAANWRRKVLATFFLSDSHCRVSALSSFLSSNGSGSFNSADMVVIATDSAQLDESGIMNHLLVLPL